MTFLSGFLLVSASAAATYAAILLLVRAFRTSLAWGLITLLVPLGNVVFIFAHWAQGRRPFVAHIIALALLAGAVCSSPALMKSFPPAMQLSIGQHPSAAPAGQGDQPEDLNAEIAAAQAGTARLQQQVASAITSLTSVYNDLATRRAQLKPGDQQATAAFNRDAAAYTARKKQLDALRTEAQANDAQLSALLEKRAEVAAKSLADSRNIVMYGTSWCPACKMARQYLDSKGVAYRDVDVEHDPGGAAEFRQRGGGPIPMIVMNGDQTTGFNSAWVDAHLQ